MSTVPSPLKASTVGGQTSVPLWSSLEASTQATTVIRGSVLKASSGFLAAAAADDNTLIAGISGEACHNITAGTQMLSFIPALPGLIFEGCLEGSSSTSHASTNASIYVQYGIDIDTANHRYFLDFDETTAKLYTVIRLMEPLGTVKSRVQFVFMASKTIFG